MSLQKTGVYCIRNLFDGKIYVGSAAKGIISRWKYHLTGLRKNHPNWKIRKAASHCGVFAFELDILEECPPDKCIEREQYWMNELNPEYNICPNAGSPLGRKLSAEACAKISARLKGNKWNKGKKATPETREAMRRANVNRKPTKTQLDALDRSRLGRVLSKETRIKMSNSARGNKRCVGRIISAETKEKIRLGNLRREWKNPGFKMSDQTKQKIRNAKIG